MKDGVEFFDGAWLRPIRLRTIRNSIVVLAATWLGGASALGADLSIASGTQTVPWLFGDWDGARTQLKDAGIDFQFGYVGEGAGNTSGGARREAAYADQFAVGTTFDFGRLSVLQGGTVQITVTNRDGTNLSNSAGLGTLQEVQEIYGRGQTARLTRFWYNQEFGGGLVEWKIGRISFSEDFSAFSCEFQNLTFCGPQAGNIATSYIYNWPISQWASRWKFNFSDFGYFQFAVFDQNPKYLGTQQALLPVFFSGSTGVLVPVELGWLPRFGGLQGSYKFGGWYDTSLAPDVVNEFTGIPSTLTGTPPPEARGRFGAYVNFLQQIWRSPRNFLSVFFNATIADHRSAFIDSQVAGGLVYTGPFPSRPNDDLGFAIGTTHVNRRIAAAEALQNLIGPGSVAVQSNEYVAEIYYTYRPLNGLEVRPNFQYVVQPGGTSQNRNVLVFGLKTVANF